MARSFVTNSGDESYLDDDVDARADERLVVGQTAVNDSDVS